MLAGCLAMFIALSAFAGEGEEVPRRRRRIMIYDESPRVLTVTQQDEFGASRDTQLDRRIRQEGTVRSGFEAPASQITLLPMVVADPGRNGGRSDRDDEDDEPGWLTSLDLLTDDDREWLEADREDPDGLNQEIEITPFEELQSAMIEAALSGEDVEDVRMDDEEWEAMLDEERESRRGRDREFSARGLDMAPVTGMSDEESRERLTRSSRDRQSRDSLETGFRPVMQVESRDRRPEPGETRRAPAELSGTRGLFGQIQERNAPGRPRSQPSSAAAPRPSPSGGQLRFEPVSGTGTSDFSGPSRGSAFSGGSGPSGRPGMEPSLRGDTPRQTAPPPRSQENRIRSQIGTSPGFDF